MADIHIKPPLVTGNPHAFTGLNIEDSFKVG